MSKVYTAQHFIQNIYTAQHFIQNIFVILINVDHDEYLEVADLGLFLIRNFTQ